MPPRRQNRSLPNRPRRPAENAKRVFLELYGPLKTVGRDTYTNDLLELAGARNVAGDAKGTVLFSAERLVQADPDVILVVGAAADGQSLASRPGMAELQSGPPGARFAPGPLLARRRPADAPVRGENS